MYIEPNTNIEIFNNVPLDNSYTHELYFPSIDAQRSYFSSRAKFRLTRQSYQRVNKGRMRVEIQAELLYDCNYMAFQNESFGGKWFYAFINNVEYVNNRTSEITFEIDTIQTYLFNINLRQSYIERQHSETDRLFENIVSENLSGGDIYTSTNDIVSVQWTDYDAVLIVGVQRSGDDWIATNGDIVGGLYTGVQLEAAKVIQDGGPLQGGIDVINGILKDIIDDNKEDGIVGAYMFPYDLVRTDAIPSNDTKYLPIEKYTSNLNGYVPRNKKLFTSPFNWIYVTSNDGQSIAIQPEFVNSTARFTLSILACCNGKPEVTLVPMYYKNKTYNYDNTISITSFPQCAINVDGYRAWVAQGGQKLLDVASQEAQTRNVMSMFTGVAEATAGNVGGIGTIASGLVNTYYTDVKRKLNESLARNYPPSIKGNTTGTAIASNHLLGFNIEHRCLAPQQARLIDDYFTMFGYAQNKIDTPNINARPHFTYIKTSNTNIDGDCPSDDIKLWCSIFEKGITFWNNPNEVGNYSVDNSPR